MNPSTPPSDATAERVQRRKHRHAQSNPLRRAARFLYRSSFAFVALIIVLLIFPSPVQVFGFAGVLGFFALRWLAEGRAIPETRVTLAFLFFFASLLVGLLISPVPDLAVATAGHALAGLLLFCAAMDWGKSASYLWNQVALFVAIGVALALTAPFTTVWIQDKLFELPAFYEREWLRFGELSISHNVAGGIEAAAPLALALIGSRRPPHRMLGALALPPLVGMLILLQSRGALLAITMGLLLFATLYRRWLLPLIPLVLLGALALNTTLGQPVPAQSVYSGSIATAPQNLDGRVEIWAQVVPLLVESPLGTGAAAFNQLAQARLAEVLAEPQRAHAHNLFLQIALDTGIVGLLSFLWIFGYGIWNAWRAYRRGTERALAAGILGAFTVIVVHGMLDTIFWGAKPGVFLWWTIGLAFALGNLFTAAGARTPDSPVEG